MGTIAIIPAAGQGRRMGNLNKQFLTLHGKPVLAHSCAAFQSMEEIEEIFLIVPPGQEDYCMKEVVGPFGLSKVKRVLPGGKERQESVWLGLQALPPGTDTVIIHDGARPLVTRGIIAAVLSSAREYGASTAAVPVKDTIKVIDDEGFGVETPPRRRLWAVQTPQAFQVPVLVAAHRLALAQNYEATDDTALVEMSGRRVKIVEGSYENIKITTPEDVFLAEKLLQRREHDADWNGI